MEIIMEPPFCNRGLLIHQMVVHIEINIKDNDNISTMIFHLLSSAKYQNVLVV